MNYKAYPTEYWTQLEETLSQLKKSGQKLVAAFDADGTLWDTDLGENFFQYQIDNKLISMPDQPWDYYLNLKSQNNDPRDAFLWLAQINKGVPIEQVQLWAQDAFRSIEPNPIFSEQKKLIDILNRNQVEVYIVTASITWAVQPGAKAIGIKTENVIGVETAIENGLITDKALLPITYRKGKLDALLKRSGNTLPFLSSGNTMGDFELLEGATHLRLAVSAASRDDKLFKTENELLKIADEKKWLGHRFI